MIQNQWSIIGRDVWNTKTSKYNTGTCHAEAHGPKDYQRQRCYHNVGWAKWFNAKATPLKEVFEIITLYSDTCCTTSLHWHAMCRMPGTNMSGVSQTSPVAIG